jgi:simple sugar transport system ATP-binding protein
MIHHGENIVGLSPKVILEKGISMSFIPEDRLGMGLAPSLSITDNMILKKYSDTKGPFVDRKTGKKDAEQVIRELEVVTPSTETPVRRLSGGNVQKVLLGREIKAGPNVIITAYPVRGLDIGSSYTIYDILNQQKEAGVGILFVGEDLDVMMALCDKIMVLCHGRIMGVVHAHKTSKEELGLMMTGALDLTDKYEDKPAGIARDTRFGEQDEKEGQ